MSQKKKEKKIYTYYGVGEGGLKRRLKKCPRCGVFMAFHRENKPRWSCGKCSYTEYVS